jgi:hypothetical protein
MVVMAVLAAAVVREVPQLLIPPVAQETRHQQVHLKEAMAVLDILVQRGQSAGEEAVHRRLVVLQLPVELRGPVEEELLRPYLVLLYPTLAVEVVAQIVAVLLQLGEAEVRVAVVVGQAVTIHMQQLLALQIPEVAVAVVDSTHHRLQMVQQAAQALSSLNTTHQFNPYLHLKVLAIGLHLLA